MISARRNFVFVHIPKTGGNSLSRLLIDYSDDELVKTEPYHDLHDRFNVRGIVTGRKHFTAADYVERIGLERFVTFRKFAFVRNPYARAMSNYFSPYRWIQEVDGRLVPEPLRFDRAAFYAFIHTMAPMTSYLSYDGKLLAFDRIGRFENFEADARELLRLCGVTIPPAAPLPFLNRGYAEKLQHYDAETAAWVHERFRDDFSAFDYDPDAYPSRRNVLITGLPRSGTTLVNAIIDGLPNALSLSEPSRHGPMFEESFSARDLVRRIRDDLPNLRQEIIDEVPLEDRRNSDGSAVTNYFAASQAGAPRSEIFSQLKVTRAGLRPDFLLGIKHNALFTGVLPHLLEVDDWSVVCIIRNPVDAVCSWRSLDLPVSHGRLPLGERYWLELREISASERDLLEKQILFCELFYRRYREAGPRVTVLRYEDLVSDLRSFLAAVGREETQPPDLVRPPAAASAAAAGRAGVSSVVRKLGAAGALPDTAHFYGNDLAGES